MPSNTSNEQLQRIWKAVTSFDDFLKSGMGNEAYIPFVAYFRKPWVEYLPETVAFDKYSDEETWLLKDLKTGSSFAYVLLVAPSSSSS